MQYPSLEELLKAGVHFGHQPKRWHPRMQPFIFGVRNGVHILDLEQTLAQLEKAGEFVKGVVARGGRVLFLGTKPQMQKFVQNAAERCGMPVVTNRWLGGTLTNFEQIRRLMKRLADLKRQTDSGELAKKYTKREVLEFTREMEELTSKVGGIADMMELPSALVVFDVRSEMTAVEEARRRGIPVVGICDTNVNPDVVQYPIAGNDDAVKAVALFTRVFADVVLEGQKQRKEATPVGATKPTAKPSEESAA